MHKSQARPKKIIRFFNGHLYRKLEVDIIDLGTIRSKCGLTKDQKLAAVSANGEWIEV